MPPFLALIICLAFCTAIYYADNKEEGDTTVSGWIIPTIWLIRAASRSMSYWFGEVDVSSAYEEGSVGDQILLTSLMIAGLYVLSKRSDKVQAVLSNNTAIVLLYLYMGISVLWSTDVDVSLRRWIKTVGDLIMVLIVLTEDAPLESISKIFRKCFILLLPLSVVLIRYYPQYGTSPSKHWLPDMWIGVATHKNTLGQMALLAGLIFLRDYFRNENLLGRAISATYLAMVAYLIYGGGHSISATSLALLLIASGVYYYLSRYESLPERFPAYLISFICILSMIVFLDIFIIENALRDLIPSLLGKDPTLTGRTDLWRDLIDIGLLNPLLGSGFGDFWTPSMIAKLKALHSWGPGQAHNGYIETFLNMGFAGLALLFLTIYCAIRGALVQCHNNYEYGLIRLIIIFVILLHNYTESSFSRPVHLMWFTFLLFAVNVDEEERNSDHDNDMES